MWNTFFGQIAGASLPLFCVCVRVWSTLLPFWFDLFWWNLVTIIIKARGYARKVMEGCASRGWATPLWNFTGLYIGARNISGSGSSYKIFLLQRLENVLVVWKISPFIGECAIFLKKSMTFEWLYLKVVQRRIYLITDNNNNNITYYWLDISVIKD